MLLLLLTLCSLHAAMGDTPADCTYEDVRGDWLFYETERSYGSNIDCAEIGTPLYKKRLSLEYPNIAVDNYGNKGTWTMIYNQGFEVRVGGRSYFAFSYFNKTGEDVVTSYCDHTLMGWSRDITVRNWSCFKGRKTTPVNPKTVTKANKQVQEGYYRTNKDFIMTLNEMQSSWIAAVYPEHEQLTLKDMQRRAGSSSLKSRVKPAIPNPLTRLRSMILPDSFDWRNLSGINYISPVRDQANCGSCYAFASMAGLEARVRILTRNEQKPVFSVQDIIECSELSQGCDGGFPYLIAGRYAQDKGVVLDECSKYDPDNVRSKCTTKSSCLRHYTAYYRYVGGYYGACNEEEMKLSLVKGGPLMVGFEVYPDFLSYSGGIYHHTAMLDRFNPLEETNHAVLVVGYGEDPETKEKFWSVKNSWGTGWGEEGYFRIRRGNDECGIESMAVEVVPIPA